MDIIRDNVSEEAFSTWFEPIIPISYVSKELTIQVPTHFFYEHLEEKFLGLLKETIYKVTGERTRLMYSVVLEKQSGTTINFEGSQTSYAKDRSSEGKKSFNGDPFKNHIISDLDPQLNPKYTFGTFMGGVSNKLARSAAETIALSPGRTAFNPLYIHGKSGVGKTHLMHAIGLGVKENNPLSRVLYVSAHLFQVQYTDAVRNNTVNDFINFYQSIDVLMIDDIQEFIGKTSTQNTFFHIFNHLHQTGKQLVISCDKQHFELQGMAERLLTRFKWGLSAELESPDQELRKLIVKSKARHDGLSIPPEVIELIAARIVGSARDLEGVIVSLIAHSMVYNRDIDLEFAERVINKSIKNIQREITVDLIQAKVCEHFNVTPSDIHSKTRKREIVNARQVSMYLTKKLTNHSYSRVGELIGKRDHATVVHACKVVKDQMSVDKTFFECINEIESVIKG